jgi:hypothetical protein
VLPPALCNKLPSAAAAGPSPALPPPGPPPCMYWLRLVRLDLPMRLGVASAAVAAAAAAAACCCGSLKVAVCSWILVVPVWSSLRMLWYVMPCSSDQ